MQEVGFNDLLEIAKAYGPSGIIIAWFVWRDWRRDVRDEAREKARAELDRERTKADLALASGYAILAERLERLTRV